MTDTGQPENGTGTGPRQPSSYGYCAWHSGHSRSVRLIQVEEAASSPSSAGNRFACHPCRTAYDLVPFADRPL